MKKSTIQTHRHILGIILIIVAIFLILYDFFSPPVGEISNVTLILFCKDYRHCRLSYEYQH